MKIATCNPQPGCVFDFEIVLSTRCETQLYIVDYFFNFYFIYIRYAYTHTHAKGESRKVAGCGLRFRNTTQTPKKRNLQLCNPQLCNFRNSRFLGCIRKHFHVWHEAVRGLTGNVGIPIRGSFYGSPRCLTIASTSGLRKVRRFGL